MEVLIDAPLMERFLGPRPKVFLSAREAAGELGALTAGAEPLCDVWILERAGERLGLRLLGEMAEGPVELIPALQPPASICAFAGVARAAHDDLEQLRAWWAANSPTPAPPVATGIGLETILLQLFRGALADLHDSAAQQALLASELYLLRSEHEETRTALKSLQGQQARYQPGMDLAASLPPAGITFSARAEQGTLTQYLPIAAEGLACFDLHLGQSGSSSGRGQVLVSLHALDRDQTLGCWRMPTEHCPAGWVRFALEEALMLSAHDLQLMVSWNGSPATLPAISLADVRDWPELRAQSADGLVLDGALAVMLWSAAPGTRLKGGVPCGTWLPGGACEFRLTPPELGRALLSCPGPASAIPVLRDHPEGGLLLHPTGRQPSVACLPDTCSAGTQAVSATVRTSHPQAVGHVEYALFLTRHDPAWEIARLDDPSADPRVLAFSGWETVPPDQLPYAVCLHLSKPLDRPAHLVLATRSSESCAHAWAQWAEIRMRFRAPVQVIEQQRAAGAAKLAA